MCHMAPKTTVLHTITLETRSETISVDIGRLESSNFLEVLSKGMGGAGDGSVAVSRDPMEL